MLATTAFAALMATYMVLWNSSILHIFSPLCLNSIKALLDKAPTFYLTEHCMVVIAHNQQVCVCVDAERFSKLFPCKSRFLFLIVNITNAALNFTPPWNRVLHESVTGPQLAKEFPTFYGPRRFIISFTPACHLSLSGAKWIQSMPSCPLFKDQF